MTSLLASGEQALTSSQNIGPPSTPKVDEEGENVETPGVKEVGPVLAPSDGKALSGILGNGACWNTIM